MANNKKEDVFSELLKKNTNLQQPQKDTTLAITISSELKSFIPPLTKEEYELLERSILAEGCREALIVWKNGSDFILVDGHNRYEICKKHKKLFNTQTKEFSSIEEVKDWMINNQLGKRNVTEEVKSYLRGLQYKTEKLKQGGSGNNQFSNVDNLSTLLRTSEKLAKEHKVSAKTIERDEKFFEGLDLITTDDLSLKWKILNREILIPKSIISDLPKKTKDEIKEVIEKINKGIPFTKGTARFSDDRRKEITNLLTSFFKNYDKDTLEKIKELVQKLENLV